MSQNSPARRLGERIHLRRPGKIIDANGYPTDVMILDFSSTGVRIEAPNGATVPDRCQLRFQHDGSCREVEVIWRRLDEFGLRFVNEPVMPSSPQPPPLVGVPAARKVSMMELRNIALKSKR